MFELLERLWEALTGGSAKTEKAEMQEKAQEQAVHNAGNASGRRIVPTVQQKNGIQGKYNKIDNQKKNHEQNEHNAKGKSQAVSKSVRRQYAGRLPICAGCMNIGGCAGFFPGCGCYGNSHDTVKVSAGDWQSKRHIAKGSGIASPEFAAWCAFMGYVVAERYWAEYEDVWNYYEAALQEYGSEYEAFDELDNLNEYDEFVDDIDDVDDEYDKHDEYAVGEYDGDACNDVDVIDNVDDLDGFYDGGDDGSGYDDACDNEHTCDYGYDYGYDRNDAAYDDYDHDSNSGSYDDFGSGYYGDEDY